MKKYLSLLLALLLIFSLAACGGGDNKGGDDKSGDDKTGTERIDTEVSGGFDGSLEWLDYWTGDWYGWWAMTDPTGEYADFGEGVWDACAYIEA